MSMEPGDIVTLTAGSDPMTVERVEDDSVHCVWFPVATYAVDPEGGDTFAIYGELRRDTFPSAALEPVVLCEDCQAVRSAGPNLTSVD